MATLTVRNLEDAIVKQLRIRAAEHGRSAEAEHREILRTALLGTSAQARHQMIGQLEEFQRQTGGRGGPSSAELLAESRAMRMRQLTGSDM